MNMTKKKLICFSLLLSMVFSFPSYGFDLLQVLTSALNAPDVDTNMESLIAGRAYHLKVGKEFPLRNVDVVLSQGGRVIAKSKTSHVGEFSFYSRLVAGDCTFDLGACKYIYKFVPGNKNSDILIECPSE